LKIRLDLGVIFEHQNDVIHDLTHVEVLRDVSKLLADKDVQQTIIDHHGHRMLEQLGNHLEYIAAGDIPPKKGTETGLQWLRMGATINALALNPSSAIQQPLGIFQAAVLIGPKWMGIGVHKFLTNPRAMRRMIDAEAPGMITRARAFTRELHEVRNTTTARGAVIGEAEAAFFWLLLKFQSWLDSAIYLGAKEKAWAEMDPTLDLEVAEARAIDRAFQDVESSQSGGGTKGTGSGSARRPLEKNMD